MDFDTLVANMDDTLVVAFQKVTEDGPLQVTLHPNDGTGDITVPCIVKNPVLEEDYVPGSQKGTGELVLFIPASAGVVSLRGQTATYGGIDYNIEISDADRCGGVHIHMRMRSQPYDS